MNNCIKQKKNWATLHFSHIGSLMDEKFLLQIYSTSSLVVTLVVSLLGRKLSFV